jgi:hypothetical protein
MNGTKEPYETTSLRAEIFNRERVHRKLVKDQKDELKRRVLSLPDNPEIKRVSENAFTCSFSGLGSNWSVEHHNFATVYRLVAEIIDRAESPLSAIRQIRRATIEKKIVVKGKSQGGMNYAVGLHPKVVAGLKTVLRG